jgi:hypothetical protein
MIQAKTANQVARERFDDLPEVVAARQEHDRICAAAKADFAEAEQAWKVANEKMALAIKHASRVLRIARMQAELDAMRAQSDD